MSYNNQWLEFRRAERRAHRQTQLRHDLNIAISITCFIAVLALVALLLTSCAGAPTHTAALITDCATLQTVDAYGNIADDVIAVSARGVALGATTMQRLVECVR